jgi:hypothetical protein
MFVDKKIGAFIDAARATNDTRPVLTRVEVSTQPVPYLPIEEGQCILSATDGYRMHTHIAQQNGASGICHLAKQGRESYIATPDPDYLDQRYPDYRAIFPQHGEWLIVTDWPKDLTVATAKGMAKALLAATFAPKNGNLRFTGFLPIGSYSYTKRMETGGITMNAQFAAQAMMIPSTSGYNVNFTAPNRPLIFRPLSDMGALAVVSPYLPPAPRR